MCNVRTGHEGDIVLDVEPYALSVTGFRNYRRRTSRIPNILEDCSTSLSGTLRFLLVEPKQELDQLAGHIEQAETLIQRAAQESEACQRLDAILGSARSRPLRSSPRSEMAEHSARAGSSQPE